MTALNTLSHVRTLVLFVVDNNYNDLLLILIVIYCTVCTERQARTHKTSIRLKLYE